MKTPYSSKSTLSVCPEFVSPAALKSTTLKGRSSNISALKAGVSEVREDDETTKGSTNAPGVDGWGFNPKS